MSIIELRLVVSFRFTLFSFRIMQKRQLLDQARDKGGVVRAVARGGAILEADEVVVLQARRQGISWARDEHIEDINHVVPSTPAPEAGNVAACDA